MVTTRRQNELTLLLEVLDIQPGFPAIMVPLDARRKLRSQDGSAILSPRPNLEPSTRLVADESMESGWCLESGGRGVSRIWNRIRGGGGVGGL
jgi:hypothetical protein